MSGERLTPQAVALRGGCLEVAAAHAWEHDHPSTPWAQAPASVRIAMRALVGPTVDAVLWHLGDAQQLATVEPDTFPAGTPLDAAVIRALSLARGCRRRVRFVLKGTPLVAEPGDTWQDVATRYHEAANDPGRQ